MHESLARDGESISVDLESSHLKILEPVGIFESKPVAVQEVTTGDLVQIQLSYPISPPFPQHVDAKVANRSLTAVWAAGSEGEVVTLKGSTPQTGKIGVGFFSVYVPANNAGPSSVDVTVTLADGKNVQVKIPLLIVDPKQADGVVKVSKITAIDYVFETSDPPDLIVTAVGQVPTLGWTKPVLVRRTYIQPPADGIWEYDLYGVPPSGVAGQMISPVSATNRWEHVEHALSIKGVRVYGEGGGIMERLFE
jgi:hypothetical protein